MMGVSFEKNGRFCVVYAGALGLANDIPTILKSAYRLKDNPKIHFLLFGDGKERTNLEKTADELNLSNVTFTGSIPKSEMPSVLAASDACIAILKDIPMFRTTYPNKVFDYMAAGKPAILLIDGVIREVIEASEGGVFVPPGDVNALADTVIALEKNREYAKSMGQSARTYVVKHFDRHNHSEAFADLILKLGK